jgi:hypothetical protein
MKYPINTLHHLSQGGLIITITMDELDRETFQPPQIARLSEGAADFDSPLKKCFDEMASDKPCSTRY